MKIDKRNRLTTQLSYIAGFIDGEGCIRIKKSNQSGNSYYITLQVTNTDKKPLELIQKIFGGKVYFQEKGVNKVVWQYYVTCNDAVNICKTLLGYSIVKTEQMKLAIDFHNNQAVYSSEQKRRRYEKMRKLKKHTIHENPELLK